MHFNLSTLHLGDVLMAAPAMREGDTVAARPEHRVQGLPVHWVDRGGVFPNDLHTRHQTDAWLALAARAPVRHQLRAEVPRSGVVLAPAVWGDKRQWEWDLWMQLFGALPEVTMLSAHAPRDTWINALNAAETVVCPDTGTAHMADALGVPRVIVLHGQGQAHFERYAPYWNRSNCIVRDTMGHITVEDVLEKISG